MKLARNGDVFSYPTLCFVPTTLGRIFIKFSMIIYAQVVAGQIPFWSLTVQYKAKRTWIRIHTKVSCPNMHECVRTIPTLVAE
jgi:hypothetical protein